MKSFPRFSFALALVFALVAGCGSDHEDPGGAGGAAGIATGGSGGGGSGGDAGHSTGGSGGGAGSGGATGGTGGDAGAGGDGGDGDATGGTGGDAGAGGDGGDTGGSGGDAGTGGDGGVGGDAGGEAGAGGDGGAEAFCGDGAVDPGEECDDGANSSGDGCSSTCEWEATPIALPGGSVQVAGSINVFWWERVGADCVPVPSSTGDYLHSFPIVNATGHEQRVRIRTTTASGYSSIVLAYRFPFSPSSPEQGCITGDESFSNPFHPTIRDLRVQPDELYVVVVSSTNGEPPTAPPSVEVFTEDRPGDGVVGASESCDDGNTSDGDGCSGTGQLEDGWTCSTAGADCVPNVCGDGLRGGGEACDDDNTDDEDGCSSACIVEDGWACPTAGAACRPVVCGDGFVDLPETCDEAGDGCDASCAILFFDTAATEKIPPLGASLPLGRWATRILDQQPWVYSFAAEAGKRYEAELHGGGIDACTPTGGPGYTNAPRLTLNTAFGQPIDSADTHGADCPRLTIEPAADDTFALWVFVDGPGGTDPMYLRIVEAP